MKTIKGTAGLIIFTTIAIINSSSCEKKPGLPVVVTSEISDITQFNAISGGTVTADGGADVTDSGICWSTDEVPTVEDNKISCCAGTGSYIIRIKPLVAGTKYYLRAYATNSEGTAYGDQLAFETAGKSISRVITNIVTEIGMTSALSGGFIYDSGGAEVSSKGVCWSKNPSPTILDNKTSDSFISWRPDAFKSNLTGLETGTKYYVRAYAVTEIGTFYGNETEFSTQSLALPTFNQDLVYGTIVDIDGNQYKTIEIGTQTWMAENLRTTRLSDGTPVILFSSWKSGLIPAMCWYNDDPVSYGSNLGAYYNIYAVNTKKLCPDGWHIPDRDDWTKLISFLGTPGDAGGSLKEAGFSNWAIPNYGATNESGFTSVPAGYRSDKFIQRGLSANYWSSSTTYNYYGTYPDSYVLDYRYKNISIIVVTSYYSGLSVRCIKN